MYCINCGKEIADDSKFCTYCGSEALITNNVGKITIRRNERFSGWLLDLRVYIDGKYIGSVSNGGVITRDISFGKHSITVGYLAGKSMQQIEVRQEAPNIYVEVEMQMGIVTNKPRIVNVKAEK